MSLISLTSVIMLQRLFNVSFVKYHCTGMFGKDTLEKVLLMSNFKTFWECNRACIFFVMNLLINLRSTMQRV